MKLNRFNYLMAQGVKNIFTHGFMSFASITIIIACLLIMGSFSLLTLNIDANIDRLQNQNEVIAYVDETLTEDEARTIEPKVAAVANVASVEFVTREQAMQTFEAEYDSDLFDNIDASVFRHRYVVTLDDLSLMKDTQAALSLFQAGLSKVVPLYPSSTKHWVLVKPFSSAYFCRMAF